MSSLVTVGVYEDDERLGGRISSRLVRRTRLLVGDVCAFSNGAISLSGHSGWSVVRVDTGGNGDGANSSGSSGTGGCTGVFTLGRRRLPLETRWLRVFAAERRLSRVPFGVRVLRVLLPLRALLVLFPLRVLRMLAVSEMSW